MLTVAAVSAELAIVVTGVVGICAAAFPAMAFARRARSEIEADTERELRHAQRQVLEEGAVLLRRFMGAVASVRPAGKPGQVDPASLDELERVGPEVGAHSARMPLWFPSGSEITSAWEEAVAAIGSRLGAESTAESDDRLHDALDRYATAARGVLLAGG